MANEIVNTNQQDPNTSGKIALLKPNPTLLEIRKDRVTYPRLLTIPEAEAKVELGLIVMMASQYRGQNIDADTATQLTKSLYDELMQDEDKVGLRYLTMEEIKRVIKRALTGQTKRELFGVNVASLLTALTDYAKDEGAKLQEQVERENFLRQGDLRYQQLTACARVLAHQWKVK